MSKNIDAGQAGNGHEFATHACNGVWENPAAALQDQANFELFGRLALRSHGDTISIATVETGVYKHTSKMLPSGTLQLPSSTVISSLGGANFLMAGFVVNRFRMEQQGNQPVEMTFDLLGSGKHRSPNNVSSLPASPVVTTCLKGGSYLGYTDSGGAKDLTTGCRVKSWYYEVQNAHNPNDDRCIGDPEQIAGDYTDSTGASAAAYNSKLSIGDRVVSAGWTILLDSTLPEWLQMAENEAITDIVLGAKGPAFGALPSYWAIKATIPAGQFILVDEVDANGKAALNVQVLPFYSSSVNGASKIEVINDTATNFD
jgi:hypothetical protein